MKIYWTLSSVPELAALPQSERKQIWRSAYLKSFRNKYTWLGLLICGVCAGLGSLIGDQFHHGIIGAGVGGGIGGFISGQISTRTALPFIRMAIIQRNENGA
jgi:dolichol kinase